MQISKSRAIILGVMAALVIVPVVFLVFPDTRETACTNPLIKGNVNINNEKIYHTPENIYWDRTIITSEKGERLFCTEAGAKMAGFRKTGL